MFDDWRGRLETAAQAREGGDDARAVELYASILEEAEERRERGLLVARAVDGLADLYREQHRFDLATPLYERAAGMWTRLLGTAQPRRAVTLHNLGVCYVELARWPDAERVLNDALQVWREGGHPAERIAETRKVLDAATARRPIPWKDPPR
ncbi:MAG: tetratricopeptide repeat protein [Acidobacteria bacterium]|nr:tetratricopeptide repeat protein [Acidobacteriota bacterium]NIQ84473.1 tetratricopeptide repeat protein [Acidobacteriota bacterium]